MERRLIKTGIIGLDEILGGGLLQGSITTVGGPTGSGKSTLGFQFIYKGATQYNEPGIYIAIEESKQDVLFHMSGFSWNIQQAEAENGLVFLDYPVHEVDQVLGQSSALQEIINNTGAKRLVIDSIMPIALHLQNEDERKRGFLKLIENIRRWGTTTMIIGEDIKATPKSEELPSSKYGIETFTDGWINLFYRFNPNTNERSRLIEVLKMKGMEHSHKAYSVRINKEGVSLTDFIRQAPPAPEPKAAEQPKKEEKVVFEPSATAKISFAIAPPPKPPPKKKLHHPVSKEPKPTAPAAKPVAPKPPPRAKAPEKTKEKEAKADIERRKEILRQKIEEAKKRILSKNVSKKKGRKKE